MLLNFLLLFCFVACLVQSLLLLSAMQTLRLRIRARDVVVVHTQITCETSDAQELQLPAICWRSTTYFTTTYLCNCESLASENYTQALALTQFRRRVACDKRRKGRLTAKKSKRLVFGVIAQAVWMRVQALTDAGRAPITSFAISLARSFISCFARNVFTMAGAQCTHSHIWTTGVADSTKQIPCVLWPGQMLSVLWKSERRAIASIKIR